MSEDIALGDVCDKIKISMYERDQVRIKQLEEENEEYADGLQQWSKDYYTLQSECEDSMVENQRLESGLLNLATWGHGTMTDMSEYAERVLHKEEEQKLTTRPFPKVDMNFKGLEKELATWARHIQDRIKALEKLKDE